MIRNPLVLGLIVGWLGGVLWWSGLMIAFGPSTRVTVKGGEWHEERIGITSRLSYGPLVAIPWAVIGLIVGALNLPFRSYTIPITAILGVLAAGALSLATRRFDGWLAMMMQVDCFVGIVIGTIVGVMIASGAEHKMRPAIDRSNETPTP
jgi:hypothetical protein